MPPSLCEVTNEQDEDALTACDVHILENAPLPAANSDIASELPAVRPMPPRDEDASDQRTMLRVGMLESAPDASICPNHQAAFGYGASKLVRDGSKAHRYSDVDERATAFDTE